MPGLIVVWLVIWLGLAIWMIVDVNKYEGWAFQQAGTNKGLWIALPIVGALLCGLITLISVIIWNSSIKKKVQAAQAGGPGAPAWGAQGGYQQPPPGYQPPPPGYQPPPYQQPAPPAPDQTPPPPPPPPPVDPV